MTHSLDFAGVAEKLFLLQQLCLASQPYCRHNGICKDSQPYGHDNWNDYSHKIRRTVSGYLIEIAAKIRVLQDSSAGVIRPSVFSRADDYAFEEIPVGVVHAGSFKLSVRETCNKIIHATRAELEWKTRNTRTIDRYTHWTGKINLLGERGAEQWHLELDVYAWTFAVDIYIDHVLSSEDGQALDFG